MTTTKKYNAMGWAIIPVKANTKETNIKGWQKRTNDEFNPEEFEDGVNIGVVLGENSGGLVDIDLDCDEAIRLAGHYLPETGIKFGHGGSDTHYFYQVDDCGKTSRYGGIGDDGTLIEVRANAAYTIIPPSVHPSGEVIAYSEFSDIGKATWPELTEQVEYIAAACLMAKRWVEGKRHDLTMALSGTLLKAGWSPEHIYNFITAICIAAEDDEVDDRHRCFETTVKRFNNGESYTSDSKFIELTSKEVRDMLLRLLRLNNRAMVMSNREVLLNGNIEVAGVADENISLSDTGNANAFIKLHGDKVRYVEDLQMWMVWSGRKWMFDEGHGLVTKLAQDNIRNRYSELANLDKYKSDALIKWLKSSSNHRSLQEGLKLAKNDCGVVSKELDCDKLMLGCQNGLVDLKTNQFMQPNSSNLITKSCSINYNPKAKCPKFIAFIDEIFQGEAELITHVQKSLGYSLTASTDEQCFFVCYGDGANGKSTLLNLVSYIMGDYSKTAQMETFMQKKFNSNNSSDLARLQGARFITASEGEAGQALSEAMIKKFTGGDTITARYMYKGEFEYIPQGKIWLSTNHKPEVSTDEALWRRLKLIPFEATIPTERQDKELSAKLKGEAEGVLNWLIEGCLKWQAEGLIVPERVGKLTTQYKDELDSVCNFLEDDTVKERGHRISKADLFSAYQTWCMHNGEVGVSRNHFGKRVKQLGIAEYKVSSERGWEGIKFVEVANSAAAIENGEVWEQDISY